MDFTTKPVAPFILAGVFMILALPGAKGAIPERFGFTAQPDRCIALHQGQVCYQQIKFTWSTPADGEYCLYRLEQSTALTCWRGNQQSSWNLDFASSSTVVYQIRARDQQEVLSQVSVEVAWVYRSNRKSFSRWRLF